MMQPSAGERSVEAFRAHLTEGSFMLSWCRVCLSHSAPNAQQCENCASVELEWRPAGGGARLVSWAFDNMTEMPEGERRAVVVAEFAEGPWWWGRLDLDADSTLAAGATLTVSASVTDGAPVPVFHLAVQ
jgi:uncharacterized OB-fold protein